MDEDYFKEILCRWETIPFEQLEEECLRLRSKLDDLNGLQRSSEGFIGDINAWRLLNKDEEKFPASVLGDGNCLLRSGSVFAFGDEEQPCEMRVRIIIEICLHKDLYLDNDFLNEGLVHLSTQGTSLKPEFAKISPCFTHGDVLTDAVIERIFENEVQLVTKDKQEMGVWQLFALASVLKVPIISIYPRGVRKDLLNRPIKPKSMREDAPILSIMWTSTREDMHTQYWIPNHFVPVLQMMKHDVVLLKMQDHSMVGNWVAVKYDGKIYPGQVVKMLDNNIEVNAMQDVGVNKFKWPVRPDQIWYNPNDVLCIIAPPTPINRRSRYLQICPREWDELND